ncbi:MAG: [protein-PII] uridylyltransferase [Mariprofundaceae bacterium]
MQTDKEKDAASLGKIYQGISVRFDQGATGEELLRQLSAGVDQWLYQFWNEQAPQASKHIDLIAVGGYGRGELAPQSDWDIWLLTPEHLSAEIEKELQDFLHALWDMNIKLGHAVRTVRQTLEHLTEDWESATAAMESRLICGSATHYKEMEAALTVFFKKHRKTFVEAKYTELKQRHQKTGGTAFLMEPDIKEGKGGLRDVQSVFWMAKAWHGSADINDLVAMDAISEVECKHLLDAQNFLWYCRVGLHLEIKRPGERLGFEQQAALAERMGYQAMEHRPAVDRFMKDYFRHAGRIARVSGLLLMHFQEQMHPQHFKIKKKFDDGLTLEGQRIGLQHDNVFQEQPLRLLRIFLAAQQGHRHLSSQALRQIRADTFLIDENYRKNPEAKKTFLNILRQPRNVAWVLKKMNDTGVLGRFIPEFRDVVGLGQFNRYHAYTVDEHTIRAIGEARNMFHETRNRRLSLAHEVCHKLSRPSLLYIALLFHDIAKGKAGDHSIIGAEMATKFCMRLDISSDATELVSWLVREHLTMAIISQRSDLTDPEVILEFARKIGDIERLNYLLCLTVADIAAVGPNVWNDWKGGLLSNLYLATAQVLMGGKSDGEAFKRRIQTRIESTLSKLGKDREQLAVYFELLPWRCIMHFAPHQLMPMLQLLAESKGDQAVRCLNDERRSETLIMVVSPEKLGLFADLTTAIASSHIRVIAAQAFSLHDGRVLDIFHTQDREGLPILYEGDMDRLQRRILTSFHEVSDMPPPIPKQKITLLMRQVTVRVRELASISTHQSVIEVSAANRTGLLAQFVHTISLQGFHIRGAAISTFGDRAVDVFFIQNKDGATLTSAEVATLQNALKIVATLPEE